MLGRVGGYSAALLLAAIGLSSATVTYNVSLTTTPKAISQLVYGCEENSLPGSKFRRIGGNRLTAYNWENNASNAGTDYGPNNSDWFLLGQVGLPGNANQGPARFIRERINQFRADGGIGELVTVQAAGYVAADANGVVAAGETAPSARWKKVVMKKGAAFSMTPDPNDANVYMDEFIWYLQQTYGTAATGGVKYYCIDNEPDLWNSTHPRVHPNALTYPESVAVTTATAKAILDQDPAAQVFGFVSYGYGGFKYLNWVTGYGTYNAGFQGWAVAWYLDQMRQASQADGRRLMHYLDLHWYPEAQGQNASGTWTRVTDVDTSPGVCAARMQSPRSMWDPTYNEHSWVQSDLGAPVRFLPRMRELINQYYPGTKLAITEYNFANVNHISAGIAMVDALGVFGEWADAASYFADNQAYYLAATKLYLNYDGSGSSYGDQACVVSASDYDLSSVHAATYSTDGTKLSVIAVNKDTANAIAGTFNLALPAGTRVSSVQAWRFDQNSSAITHVTGAIACTASGFTDSQPPLSATLYMVSLSQGTATPTVTGTPPTATASPTPTLSFTPSPTPSASSTATPAPCAVLLNGAESLAENGTWSGNLALRSIVSSAPAGAITQGTSALQVNVTATAGYNGSIFNLDGFSQSDWSGVSQLTMDIYVEAPLLAGGGYHDMALLGNCASCGTGGLWWETLSNDKPTLSVGANHLVFNVLTSAANDYPNLSGLIFVVNSEKPTTGTLYVDNITLVKACGVVTATRTPTRTASTSPTRTLSPSPSGSPTFSVTQSGSPTASSTRTSTPTATPRFSASATGSATPTATLSHTATLFSPTATPSFSASVTGSATPSPNASSTPSATDTASPTATSSPTAISLPTRTATATGTSTGTASPSQTTSATSASTGTQTATSQPSQTALPTATAIGTPSPSPTLHQTGAAPAIEKPEIEKGYGYPNPGCSWLLLKLSAPADEVSVKIYTRALTLVGGDVIRGSWRKGWVRVPLGGSLRSKMSQGTYFAVVSASNAFGQSAPAKFKVYLLR